MCLPVGSSQQLVVGGKQPGKVMEMIMCGGIVDWNSDVFSLGVVESFLAQHFAHVICIFQVVYMHVCICIYVCTCLN